MATTIESPLDVKKFGEFTPDEQKAISEKVRKLIDEGYEQDQAIAIAIKTVAPEKSKGEKDQDGAPIKMAAPMAPTGLQEPNAKKPETMNANSPKLNGGKYTAIDTGDGFKTVKDVPIMAVVPEGAKGAPTTIDHEWHTKAVAFALDQYSTGKFLSPLHIGHNDPIHKAEFAGYVLPTRVGTLTLDWKSQSVVFADLKMTQSAFERASRGELPYLSPEVYDWTQPKIDSVAFLDTKPPFFSFPIFTVGDVKIDHAAQFQAVLANPAKFNLSYSGLQPQYNPTAMQTAQENLGRMVSIEDRVSKIERAIGLTGVMDKATATPVEPQNLLPGEPRRAGNMEPKNEKDKADKSELIEKDKKPDVKAKDEKKDDPSRMDADPKILAQFEARMAAAETKLLALEREKEERAKADVVSARILNAKKELKGYPTTDTLEKTIAMFAADGEEKLKTFVEEYKKAVPRVQPRNMEALEAEIVAEASDPVLAKFQKDGPNAVERAARYLAQYKQLKDVYGTKIQSSSEQFVDFHMKANV